MTSLVPPDAVWIGSDHPFDLAETYLNFRKDVDLPTFQTARFQIAADSRYRLWINGTQVAHGPRRSWPSAMAVDDIDLTPHLHQGHNQLAVQIYSPGYSHFAYVHRAACGWIGGLTLDGHPVTQSDRSWHVHRDPTYNPLVPRVSIYGTGVELHDLRLDTPWQTLPPTGALARLVQPQSGPIWASLTPRALPNLAETLHPLPTPWQTRLGPTPPLTNDPHQDLRAAFQTCAQAPIPQTLPANQTAIWIFDLGHSQTCTASATLTASGGETLTISYAEKLKDGEIHICDPQTYCRMRPTDRTTLRAGLQTVEGFTPRGARYLIFSLDAVSDLPLTPVFQARLTTYPLQETPFQDPDPILNAVAEMCRRTTLTCLQDGFVDSIWRENSQWLGDTVAQAFALQAISPDTRPLKLALTLAAQGAAEDGILPSVLPSDVPAYVVTDYNFAWIELLDLYTHHPAVTDGPQTLAAHRGTLEKMLARLHADVGRNGLIRSEPGRRLFLDWSQASRAEPNLTYNARYLFALQTAARLTSNPHGHAQAAQLRDAIRSRFHSTHWHESPDGAPASQLALAFLILTDTAPNPKDLADQITARSLDLEDTSPPGKLTLASPFMHHYIFQALHHLHRPAEIRAIIKARWGRWATSHEPTTWENWDITFPDSSACHGFSAHPLGWLAKTAPNP